MAYTDTAQTMLAEMGEFAGFSPCEQRYIRRSLDVGLGRQDAFRRWARGPAEAASIRTQYLIYQELRLLRTVLRDESEGGRSAGFEDLETIMAPLLHITTFDLAQGRLDSFSAYRFLYERLLGPQVRQWLPAAFCGAAALPHIRPERRKGLLQSISEAAATAPGWSPRPPRFFPEFVELEDAA